MPIATGQITSILKPALQIAEPRWSPDGRNIAVISGLMSDQGVVGGDVYLVPAAGGEARNLTPGMHASADSIQWDAARNQIVVVETVGGMAAIAALDPANARLTELWRGAESIHAAGFGLGISLARDGRTSAVTRNSFERAPEVYAGAIGSWAALTHANSLQHPSWGKVESIEWISDPFTVQGWLLYPAHYDPQRKYPLVVVVHGGPSSAAHSSWPAPVWPIG
jgi:dipeptidyl aminopeptidase/acylaminoacyl peptidase